MTAPESVRKLVERFETNREMYRSGRYNETQLRHEFLDPLFMALGWDVNNESGCAEAYKDVIHEDTVAVEGAAKAPDYSFRIGGTRKFFLEAKKPSVNIEADIHPAFQLRRYAWSAKLPLSILSDFEEFAVYDTRSKPDKGDQAASGRVLFYHYTDYIDKWDEIAGRFSREAVLKGAFDAFAGGMKGKKGTLEVDDAFLLEIERWRDLLARTLALRNPTLQVRELNYGVQMTIDRIIFLRICEDRGIEREDQLKDLLEGGKIYERLCALFRQADARYNSGLFHFQREKGESSAPDDLTLALAVDDKVLKEIIAGLYYPAPYVFSQIPADILGQVYERFLGKVIRLTAGHQAKVEEKPEVRKAGGVYYTPTYIVEYIVKNTLGRLLEGNVQPPPPSAPPPNATNELMNEQKPVVAFGGGREGVTPRDAAKLRLLDPACGSGSFLLGAYQYLLDWHTQWYCAHGPEQYARGKAPALYQAAGGEWRLTTAEKKRILLNNIYGVDIDPQAVEVTKLSLSLKVLEGESEQTLGSQLALFQERALPDLSRNIQCGNSLIGPDYYEGRQLTLGLADEEERERVNAFNWQAAFPQVFMQGGFDAVIGNPPYIRIQALQEWAPTEVEFYKKRYAAASKGNYDIYVVFVEKGLSLLNEKGRLGFILPHKFFNAQYGESLRGIISKGNHLAKVVHFGDQQVFDSATTYTCLLFLDKRINNEFDFEKVNNLQNWQRGNGSIIGSIPTKNVSISEWNFVVGNDAELFSRLIEMPIKLENATDRIFQGIKTSADKIYIVEELERRNDRVRIYCKEREAEYWLEPDLLHPLIKGGNSKRYQILSTNRLLLFPYSLQDERISLIRESILKSSYPLTWAYLLANKTYLENRENRKMKGNHWYAYIYPKNFDVIILPKIFTPDIAAHSSFSLDENGEFYFTGGAAGGYGVLVKSQYSREYILGLLNSHLLEWFLHKIATTMRGGWYSYESRFIRNLPIRAIDIDNPADKARHDQMVVLVERMLELHKRQGRTPQEAERLHREITETDAAIDRLVYELYGLTQEEIRIVESA
jgi:hypothetical protein